MANRSSVSVPFAAGQVPRLPVLNAVDSAVAALELGVESVPEVPVQSSVSTLVGRVCSRCGGSGRLRINDDSFRTCLDCLGQGVLSRHPAHNSLSEWIAPSQLRTL